MPGPAFAQSLIMVFAARSATMEFRTGTSWASRPAVPSWYRPLTGEAAVVAGLAALAGAVLMAGGLAVAAPAEPTARLTPDSGLDWRRLLTAPVAFAITAVIGLAVGLLLKSVRRDRGGRAGVVPGGRTRAGRRERMAARPGHRSLAALRGARRPPGTARRNAVPRRSPTRRVSTSRSSPPGCAGGGDRVRERREP